jgi:hypothetical protein
MPYNPSIGSNDAFQSGVIHNTNETGHQNAFTLGDDARSSDQGLADTSARWNDMAPRAFTQSTPAGSPAETDAGVEFAQQSLGNREDTDMSNTSMSRLMMTRAGSIGQDDNAD